MTVWLFYVAVAALFGSGSVQSFTYYQELRSNVSNDCTNKLHCYPPAAAVFGILATHEGIVEPSVYVIITKGNPATIYASFPTREAKNLKQVHPQHPLHSEYKMNLIFRRRADAYGRFFDDLSKEPSLKQNFSFVTVLRDDCTLKPATSDALFRAGHFFGTFSHRGVVNADRVLSVPDHRFIDTNGFYSLLNKLNNMSIPFADKVPSLFWRGTSSGSKVACLDILRVQIALKLRGDAAANFKISKPKVCEMNNTYLDFEAAGIFGHYAAEEEWVKYRAIVDVDGNFATNGLPWRVLSGSVLFRVNSSNHGWIESLLEPYVHFLPLRSDLSDLSAATRLASTTDKAEVAMLETIAQNAKRLSDRLSYASVVHHFSLDVNKLTELRTKTLLSR
jgi:hypothetical protein